MLETIAIQTVWGKAWNALKSVPWWVWVALAVAAFWWIDRGAQYREGRSEGRESVLAELRAAEAKTREKAAEAVRKGNVAGEKRALDFAEKQAEQIKKIEKAEASDENALDAYF